MNTRGTYQFIERDTRQNISAPLTLHVEFDQFSRERAAWAAQNGAPASIIASTLRPEFKIILHHAQGGDSWHELAEFQRHYSMPLRDGRGMNLLRDLPIVCGENMARLVIEHDRWPTEVTTHFFDVLAKILPNAHERLLAATKAGAEVFT